MISLEAAEQSRRLSLPVIEFVDDVEEWSSDRAGDRFVVFDKAEWSDLWSTSVKDRENFVWWVVWPEGWFSFSDLGRFADYDIVSLGDTVLRMETAVIVGSWSLLRRMADKK